MQNKKMTEPKYQILNTKYKIHTFKDLETWKQAHILVLMIYKASSGFPKYELYSLVDQIRRAVVSISSNIAEGFSRNTKKEKVRFYNISLGSLLEIQNQTQIALDLNYIQEPTFSKIENQIILVQKLINGLIKSSKTK